MLSRVPGGPLVSRAYLVVAVRRGEVVRYVRSGSVAVRWRGHERVDELVKAELNASAAAVSVGFGPGLACRRPEVLTSIHSSSLTSAV